ncbi:MAG: Ig-like domain-containing protein, partial [Methylococcaceae bacterium]
TGFDTMIGGDGNDFYFVDNVGDKVTEAAKATSGIDSVQSSIDYTLPVNVENLELTGLANLKATGNTAANLITGNNGDNLLNGGDGFDTLMGGDGDDTLIGGTGVDQLIGGDGSDTYQISSTEDKIVETARDGDQDVVESSVSYTLGDYLEMLTLTGSKTVNGTGNTLDNTLEGNEADNQLNGMAGDDTLIGNGGDDTLTGGAGDDEIDGGEGDDTVSYQGNRDDYSVFLDTDSQTWIVEDIESGNGDEGTDRLSNIETIQFADGPYIPGLPTLNLADIRLNEGNKGISSAIFVFTLSEPASQAVTIDYATADETAIAGSDYITARGTVTIPKGQTRQTLTLNVIGDTTPESDETFLLQLSNVDGAVLDTTEATATITNDDQPSLSIKSIDVTEGNSGSSKAVLTVSLSQRASQPVTVQYSTGTGGTATAGVDYTAVASSLTFNPGETSKTLSIDIKGDTLVEANENFRVQLTSPQNALLDTTAASATVNIINDDRLTLQISSDKQILNAGDTANLTFTFSDIPLGFDASDIQVSGGRIQNVQADTSRKIYTASFVPEANQNRVNGNVSVMPGSYSDAQGTAGVASNVLNFSGDTLAPSLSISSDKTSLKANETATVTFSFSEIPMGFDVGNIMVNGGTLGPLNGTGQTRTALFTPTANTNNLNASIDVAANSYIDSVGNTGIVMNSLSLTGDTQAPGLSISSDKTSLKSGDTATVTFSFSEMPTGFDVSDISVSGGSIVVLNGTGLTRTALFTPTPNTNTLSASISVTANTYADAVGNNGLASNGLNLTGDTLAPSLSISSDKTSLKIGETASLTFSFSEMPGGFDVSNIRVNGGTLSNLNGTGLTRTALFTPTANINNLNASISVNANTYADTAGNNGLASNSLNLTGDTLAPSLSISSDKTSLKAGETTMLTFNFSETPSGFDVGNINVNGGSIELLNGTGLIRTALFTPTANTNNLSASISVNANTYADTAGNNGLASNSLSLVGDTLAPSLSISSDKTSLKTGETTMLTFNFSETPSGFDVSDISVNGGTLGNLN